MKDLTQQILNGDIRSIARAISIVENNAPLKEPLLDELYPLCGKAMIWGITGAPGAGKSTLLDRIIAAKREQQRRVAVIAVDPTSPFTGGAILGDRLRMQRHALDSGVFIRSMASRGHLGGIASATRDVIKIFDAAGYDLIFIETIGVGQSEVEVVSLADMILLVLVPGLGDEIQALKAGIMEIGDIFIINKKDREGAAKLKTEVEYVLRFKNESSSPPNPVIMTAATLNEGIAEVIAAAEQYFQYLIDSGQLEQRRRQRLRREFYDIVLTKIQQVVENRYNLTQKVERLVELVVEHHEKPYALIEKRLNSILKEIERR